MKEHERSHTMGAGGECVCPKCGATVAHRRGIPCQDERCPNCEARMLRVGSEHHEMWRRKHGG